MRWKGALVIPGLCDGEHYFLLEPIRTGVLFTQGELFTGVGLMRGALDGTKEGFNAMNAALKERAERKDQLSA